MKLRVGTQRQRGAILLAIIAVIGLCLTILVGFKIYRSLGRMKIDPNRGQGTNDMWGFAGVNSDPEVYPNCTVFSTDAAPDFQFSMAFDADSPPTNFTYWVQSSTNLKDWRDESISWSEALIRVQTNHDAPCFFYRRQLAVW